MLQQALFGMSDYYKIGASNWIKDSDKFQKFYKMFRTLPPHDHNYEKLHPCVIAIEHQEARRFISDSLAVPFDGFTVVVTHHPPSPWGLRYAGRFIPDYIDDMKFDVLHKTFPSVSWMRLGTYASHMDGLIKTYSPNLWIHGHIHQKMAYWIGDTPVLSNAIGHRPPSESVFTPSTISATGFPYIVQRQSQIYLRRNHLKWIDEDVMPIFSKNDDEIILLAPHAWRLHCETLEQCFLLTASPFSNHLYSLDGTNKSYWDAARSSLLSRTKK
jgi:hypothetical protein